MSRPARIATSLSGAMAIAALIVVLAWLMVEFQRRVAEDDMREVGPDEMPPAEGSIFDRRG